MMELVLSNEFCELSQNEMEGVDGGAGAKEGAWAFAGSLLIVCSVPVCFANPAVGLELMGTGFVLLDKSYN